MPGEIASPPAVLSFESLCDLFQQYLDLLVSARHTCPRGIQVVFEPYHFSPVTSMTVKRPGIKEHRKGQKLWPKIESHLG